MWVKKKTLFYTIVIGLVFLISAPSLSIGVLRNPISIPCTGTMVYLSPLHTLGYSIYNSFGKRINLYSATIQNGGQGQEVKLSDIQAIKALGFNTFRLFLYWGLVQPYNETLDGVDVTYFTTARAPLFHGIDEVVNWAVEENLYINLCMCWTETWAPPSWAFQELSDDAQRYASLINGTTSKERTGIVNAWKYIANRYKGVPNVIFEFLNEPVLPQGQEFLAGDPYKTFNEEIITAIESVETISHLKIVELIVDTPACVEILDYASDIDKPNVLWASHSYAPMYNWDPAALITIDSPFTWKGQYFEAGLHNQTVYVAWRLIRMAEKIHGWNKPWINTEFGKDVNQPYWDLWFDTVLETKRDYNITGWSIFTYCPVAAACPGYNIKDPTTRQLIMGKLMPYMIQQ